MWAGEGPSHGSHPGDRKTHAPRPLPGPGTQLVPSKCVRMESRRNLLIRWRPAVRLTETPTPCRSVCLREKAAGQSQGAAASSRLPVSGHTGGSGQCARCGPRPPTADGGGHPELGEDISGTEWKSRAGERKPVVMGTRTSLQRPPARSVPDMPHPSCCRAFPRALRLRGQGYRGTLGTGLKPPQSRAFLAAECRPMPTWLASDWQLEIGVS